MAPPLEKFNRTRAEGILQRWYSEFTNGGKNPIFSPNIDSDISGYAMAMAAGSNPLSGFSTTERTWPRDYALLNQVERMIQSGYIEQDISDALSRVATSVAQQYKDDDGIFGKRGWLDFSDAGRGERASEYIAKRLSNAFPDGKSDAELTDIYNKFANYLPKNSADILKSFEYKTSDALNRHITNNKGWADDIILGEARKLLGRNPDIESELELLAELAGMSTDNLPEAITALYLGFPQNEDGTNLTPAQRSEYIRNFSADNISEQMEMKDRIGVSAPAETAAAEVEEATGIPEQIPVPQDAPLAVKNAVSAGATYFGQNPDTNNYRVGYFDNRGQLQLTNIAPNGAIIPATQEAGAGFSGTLSPAAMGIGFNPTVEGPMAEQPQGQTFSGLTAGEALQVMQMNANAVQAGFNRTQSAEQIRIQKEQNDAINAYNLQAAALTAQYRGDTLEQDKELAKLTRDLQMELHQTVSGGTQAQIDAANTRFKQVSGNVQAQLDQQKFEFANISATDAATLAERERAARAGEVGATFRQQIASQPALEQASLARMTRLDDLLSDGGNYLARAFAQYGMKPPTTQPTLADRVNNTVRDEIITRNQEAQADYDAAVAALMATEYGKEKDLAEQQAWDAYVAANTTAGQGYQPAVYNKAQLAEDIEAAQQRNIDILATEGMQNWAATLAGEGVPDFVTAGLEEEGEIDDFAAAQAALTAGNPYAGLRSYGEALPTMGEGYLTTPEQQAVSPSFTGVGRDDWRQGFKFGAQDEWAKALTPEQRAAIGLPPEPQYEDVPPETSMEALVAQARGFLSPAATDVYFGDAARPKIDTGFALPSYQQYQRLDPEQRDALNTMALTEFNIPLDVAMHEERLRGAGARTTPSPAVFANRPTQMFRNVPFRTTGTGLRVDSRTRRPAPVQPAMFRPA
tara:strand:+ start:3472 stop:6228 length:2757 start_codon:yes stop_codon:yes gene_type:complete